jgi:hypothetical protein
MIMPNLEEAAFAAHLEKARAGEIVSQLQVAQSTPWELVWPSPVSLFIVTFE